jgi:N-acyl-D-amino-acid deacylase
MRRFALALLLLAALLSGQEYDVIVRNGRVVDGTGRKPRQADLALKDDRIAAIGELGQARAKVEIEARGLTVAPGFVNMLSWATGTLSRDGRAQSDIRQGVTLEVFGEGTSPGPTKELGFAAAMEALEKRGLAVNIASFTGATTLRINEAGHADRAPTAEELRRMTALAAQSMREGSLGIGSSLIYAPAFYAKTGELISLCKAVAPLGGMYISHLRSEGNQFLEALDELLTIAREAGLPAEVWHLKAGGKENWPKMAQAIRKIEQARKQGLKITADMYTYEAGATGLNAGMPPWVQEGGPQEWYARLRDPAMRARVIQEMRTPTGQWENLMLAAGGDGVLLLDFRNESLRKYLGKRLSEVARERGVSVEDAAIDLVLADQSRVGVAYFLMSEANIRRQMKLKWVSFGSDAGAPSAEGEFLRNSSHPRAYGNFARVLGKYSRDEKLISLPEAVRRLAALPADNLKLHRRGYLKPGYYADVVVFDPAQVRDYATYDKPHQYSTGMVHVFVNGKQVLKDGEPTGTPAGRFVRGAGYTGPR